MLPYVCVVTSKRGRTACLLLLPVVMCDLLPHATSGHLHCSFVHSACLTSFLLLFYFRVDVCVRDADAYLRYIVRVLMLTDCHFTVTPHSPRISLQPSFRRYRVPYSSRVFIKRIRSPLFVSYVCYSNICLIKRPNNSFVNVCTTCLHLATIRCCRRDALFNIDKTC